MNTDPYTPNPPVVDHDEQATAQSKLAAQIAKARALAFLAGLLQPNPRGHRRAGITTNKGKPRNKARAKMARESRRRNRR